jgi:hypothetical protein
MTHIVLFLNDVHSAAESAYCCMPVTKLTKPHEASPILLMTAAHTHRFTASKQALGQWVFDQAPDMDVREVFDGRRYRGPSALDACREQPVSGAVMLGRNVYCLHTVHALQLQSLMLAHQ